MGVVGAAAAVAGGSRRCPRRVLGMVAETQRGRTVDDARHSPAICAGSVMAGFDHSLETAAAGVPGPESKEVQVVGVAAAAALAAAVCSGSMPKGRYRSTCP